MFHILKKAKSKKYTAETDRCRPHRRHSSFRKYTSPSRILTAKSRASRGSISLFMKVHKIECVCFKQKEAISILSGNPL